MKKNKNIIIALVVVSVLAAIFMVIYLSEDREAPVLTINTSNIKAYSKEQGESVLKSYVKAVDKKDGDVSANVIVENIYISSDLSKATVIYAARDNSGNVSKISYIFDYKPTEEELEAKKKDDNQEETTAQGTEKAAQGSVKSSTELTSSSLTENTDTTDETTEAVTVAGGPKLVLEKTEDTISVGSKFNVMKYVSEITDDKDNSDSLSRRIITDGKYDTSKAGTYKIDVYCTDSDKNQSNHVTFTLNVK